MEKFTLKMVEHKDRYDTSAVHKYPHDKEYYYLGHTFITFKKDNTFYNVYATIYMDTDWKENKQIYIRESKSFDEEFNILDKEEIIEITDDCDKEFTNFTIRIKDPVTREWYDGVGLSLKNNENSTFISKENAQAFIEYAKTLNLDYVLAN